MKTKSVKLICSHSIFCSVPSNCKHKKMHYTNRRIFGEAGTFCASYPCPFFTVVFPEYEGSKPMCIEVEDEK